MTVKQFVGAEISGWLLAVVVFGYPAGMSEGFGGVVFVICAMNLLVAVVNMVGMIVTVATGWVPWKESHDAYRK